MVAAAAGTATDTSMSYRRHHHIASTLVPERTHHRLYIITNKRHDGTTTQDGPIGCKELYTQQSTIHTIYKGLFPRTYTHAHTHRVVEQEHETERTERD